MNEIQWLTRLDDIKILLGFMIAFAFVCSVISIIIIATTFGKFYEWEKRSFNLGKKLLTPSITITILLSLITCFIPNTKDAYIIYGLGGTI